VRITTIRSHILLLALAVSIPLVIIVGLAIYSDMQQNIAYTKASLRILANTMVRNTGQKIANTREVLERIAKRPLVIKRDPNHCDPLLRNLKELSPGFANLGYSNIDGLVICTAVPRPGGMPVNLSKTPWFKKVVKEKNFNISQPFLGPLTGKWVSVLSVPVWNKHHKMVGVTSIPLDLNAFDPNIPNQLLPEGSHYGFFSEDGILVWRNVDPQKVVGTRPTAEAAKRIIQEQDGEFVSVAADGVSRFISAVHMHDIGMIAWVAVPTSAIFSSARQRAIKSSIIVAVIIAFLYLIARFIAQRITSPIAELERAARGVRGGDLNVRAAVGGPRDIAAVAIEFNAMISSQQQNLEQLRIAATAFESQDSLIITDSNQIILQVNKAFTESTGYTAEEVIGKSPRLFKSDRHNSEFFHDMWKDIQQTGTWRGEIWDRRKNGEVYPKSLTITAVKDATGLVTHYVGSHIDITERKAAEDKINQLAFYDPLTKLPNRRLLMDRLQHALATSERSGKKGALLFIDLDNFKSLNDTQGHEKGDLLLKQVADRLNGCVRGGDTVARLGGDEFVLILENIHERTLEAAAQAEDISEKIIRALNQSSKLGSYEYNSTASIGVTMFTGIQASIEELMKQADIAMYQAKKAGRNAVCFYDRQMQDEIFARVLLEDELRIALGQNQFILYFQTQVDRSSRMLGVEGLVRWQHPTRGLLLPEEFIPLAEESGLILPLGNWVLSTACRQLASWSLKQETAQLTMSVNVSVKQLHQPAFVEEVLGMIEYFGINPALLKLEITESMLLSNVDETILKMNRLKTRGVYFSLDDFGTGYSSLQYLKRLPIDQLKIDQSFVSDIANDNSDEAMVRTIIAMAQSMGLEVIAEGVETESQRLLLMNNGCNRFQGNLFGKPETIDQFEKLFMQA